ncbi:MAG: hypothetical protein HS128_06750 [Ideonella sp.]|nr:hypothetical protein [Ideonella sp.]MCC7456429.1 hypothetical protein [Nitrospira sp.]
MLTLERTPIELLERDEAARARLRAWLDAQVQPPAPIEPAAVPLSLDPQALRWLPLVVPLTAVLVAATMALIWAAAL